MPERSPAYSVRLRDEIEGRRATVAVVGLGYVGLPLAVAIADAGHTVVGIDTSAESIAALSAGYSLVEDVSEKDIRRLLEADRIRFTTSYDGASGADVAVMAVPTPIDEHRTPDLSYVVAASRSLAAVLKKGALVILESTTYPGTTEEVVVPTLVERGFTPGQDVFVAYSPERIDPGNEVWTIKNTPKVVSGLTDDCRQLVMSFYLTFIDQVVPVTSIQTGELTKLFENIFRIVNIALVNELQIICDAFGIDVWEVIDACATKPYGFMPFYPGPGLGGHCVPVDPFYLAWQARSKRVNTEFIELAGRINATMPTYVLGKIGRALNGQGKSLRESRVLVIGVAYKKNVQDVRESPAVRLIELLLGEEAIVSYHDPYVAAIEVGGAEMRSEELTDDFLAAQDCAVIVTDHDGIDWGQVTAYVPAVVDTRNILRRQALTPTVEASPTAASFE